MLLNIPLNHLNIAVRMVFALQIITVYPAIHLGDEQLIMDFGLSCARKSGVSSSTAIRRRWPSASIIDVSI